jgi:hypothetical protein
MTSAGISQYPSYAIEVSGVSPEESAEPVLDAVKNTVQVFRADRMGSVKFKKHAHVVPGMKQLRGIEVGGVQLRPERNHSVAHEGDSEYDEDGESEFFDREHLKSMLTDYLSAEPAMRYQIARNYFERALYTVQVSSREYHNDAASRNASNNGRAKTRSPICCTRMLPIACLLMLGSCSRSAASSLPA